MEILSFSIKLSPLISVAIDIHPQFLFYQEFQIYNCKALFQIFLLICTHYFMKALSITCRFLLHFENNCNFLRIFFLFAEKYLAFKISRYSFFKNFFFSQFLTTFDNFLQFFATSYNFLQLLQFSTIFHNFRQLFQVCIWEMHDHIQHSLIPYSAIKTSFDRFFPLITYFNSSTPHP